MMNRNNDLTPVGLAVDQQRLLVRGSLENAPVSDLNNRTTMNQSSEMPFKMAQ